MEQKNNTLLEMGVYDDGPYEVGDEHLLNPELVPLPANSYLGECLPTTKIQLFLCVTCVLLVQVTSSPGLTIAYKFIMSYVFTVWIYFLVLP